MYAIRSYYDNIKDKLTAGADFGIQQWTELNGNGIDPFKYNSTKYSAGIEFIPDSKSLNRYWKHIRYRAGGKYNNSHLEFSGQRINSYGVTFGLCFPMRGTKTTFNVRITSYNVCYTKLLRSDKDKFKLKIP